MRCRLSLDWIIIMTKNKKQKAVVREIARTEGVSFTRAALLDERKCEQKPLSKDVELFLNRERWAGWSLETVDRHRIAVHFDSDSPDSLVNDPVKAGKEAGIPHYVIAKGTQAQRFRFLNDVRRQIEEHLSARSFVLHTHRLENDLSALIALHGSRKDAVAEAGVESFADFRVKTIMDEGASGAYDVAKKYVYVFLYDWERTMAEASPVLKNQMNFLLEHGKDSGIHFIISTGTEDENVQMWDVRKMVNFITIRSAYSGQADTAVTRIAGAWENIQIPNW